MNALFKIVGGLAVVVVVLSVLYGILHTLLSLAVTGAVLVAFAVVCVLALAGVAAFVRGVVGLKRPAIGMRPSRAKIVKRVDKAADQTLRKMKRKIGPRS